MKKLDFQPSTIPLSLLILIKKSIKECCSTDYSAPFNFVTFNLDKNWSIITSEYVFKVPLTTHF